MSSTLEQIDPNFKSPDNKGGLIYRPFLQTEACVHGLVQEDGYFYRTAKQVCTGISPEISFLNRNNSGGRIRFTTNSSRLGIRARLQDSGYMPHMPMSGSSSIDVFTGTIAPLHYHATMRPDNAPQTIDGEVTLSGTWETITLYLPLYNGIDGVDGLELGIEPGAELKAAPPLTHTQPLVFYGSSITQGGCASRTANSYPAMVCRTLDSDFINLGFSGAAKGEPLMADYISGLSMSCFVYDYDYNAPNVEHLSRTHQPFLQRILEKQPNLPVVILTRPNPNYSEEDYGRRDVIYATYEWAVSKQYQVHFVDGWNMFGLEGRDCCTVDGCHPNDLGFYRMAEAVLPTLSRILNCGLREDH